MTATHVLCCSLLIIRRYEDIVLFMCFVFMDVFFFLNLCSAGGILSWRWCPWRQLLPVQMREKGQVMAGRGRTERE